ncbi:MAG: glycosyltransferase, partial [Ekhidna sp.]
YVFSRFLNMKLMVYSYEPHSEFMVDLGYWYSSDFKYRILNKLEWKAGMHADVIMTGTKWMVEELQRRGSNAKLFRAPTAVDPNIFKPSPELRKSIRKKIMIENHERVFIYVGKFGGLYYEEGIPRLCKHIFENIDSCKFLIVTSNDHKEISALFSKYLPTDSFIITGNLSQEDLLGCLNAADFGISGVPPSPNQKYRSPTKVAEYMLIGLPYITTSGVAEDDIYAIKHQIGVVTPDFNMAPDPPFYKTIEGLLLEEKTDQVDRIRRVGIEYRSKERIDELLRKIYGI